VRGRRWASVSTASLCMVFRATQTTEPGCELSSPVVERSAHGAGILSACPDLSTVRSGDACCAQRARGASGCTPRRRHHLRTFGVAPIACPGAGHRDRLGRQPAFNHYLSHAA
jgi:hypothetical protein